MSPALGGLELVKGLVKLSAYISPWTEGEPWWPSGAEALRGCDKGVGVYAGPGVQSRLAWIRGRLGVVEGGEVVAGGSTRLGWILWAQEEQGLGFLRVSQSVGCSSSTSENVA